MRISIVNGDRVIRGDPEFSLKPKWAGAFALWYDDIECLGVLKKEENIWRWYPKEMSQDTQTAFQKLDDAIEYLGLL